MAVATLRFGAKPVASSLSEQTEYDRGSFDGRIVDRRRHLGAITPRRCRSTVRFSKPAL